MKKKFLALMLVTSMLLSSTSVMPRETALTVGKGQTKTTNQTAPTVTKKEESLSVPTTVSHTTEEVRTEIIKEKEISVPSADVMDKVDEKVKDTEIKSIEETEKVIKELLIKVDKKSEIPLEGKNIKGLMLIRIHLLTTITSHLME